MVLKAASIIGIAVTAALAFPSVSFAVEKDSASIVLALKPKQGQNFEQDLQLAKALFTLERRIEAIRVLNEYSDERATRMLHLVSTQFYNQETATSYYEALRAISLLKWAEARELLVPALSKEPGNGLLLQRLIQVELILKQKEPLTEHLTLAEELDPDSKELKVYSAKASFDAGDEKEAYRILSAQKTLVQSNPVITVWWCDVLLKLKKYPELAAIQSRLLKDHPTWSFPIQWFIESKQLSVKEQKAFQNQLEKNLKDPAKFAQEQEAEAKRTQYQWVGYYSYDSLKLPAPTATPVKPESE
jgi:hypothetical protein